MECSDILFPSLLRLNLCCNLEIFFETLDSTLSRFAGSTSRLYLLNKRDK